MNNAGITQSSAAENLSFQDWQRMIDVNLTGVFLCAQAVGRKMIEQEIKGSESKSPILLWETPRSYVELIIIRRG